MSKVEGLAASMILLDPKKIKVGWRARKDYGDLTELAASIKEIGQLQPVVVRKSKKGDYVIIAGLRRTRACRKLGIKVRAVVVEPKDEQQSLVMQLAENVKRKNFDRLEVGEGLKRLKAIYEKANPETKQGATGRGRKSDAKAARFTKAASKELSVSEQTVYDLLSIADLPKEELEEVATAKTGRERNIAASKALSKVRKKRKEEKLEEEADKRQEERRKSKKPGTKVPAKEKRKEPEEALAHLHGTKWQDSIVKGEVPEIDLILTDPLYSLKRSTVQHTSRATINEEVKWDVLDVGWVLAVAERMARTASLVAFCPLEKIGAYEEVFAEAGLTYRGAMVWHKTNPAPSHRSAYVSAAEALVWATKSKAKYTFTPWENAGTSDAHNVFQGSICGGNERLDHPMQKPLWLMEKLIERHSTRGDVVWDPFAGTGTTLIAAKKMGRTSHGNESNKKYLRMAVLRLKAMK